MLTPAVLSPLPCRLSFLSRGLSNQHSFNNMRHTSLHARKAGNLGAENWPSKRRSSLATLLVLFLAQSSNVAVAQEGSCSGDNPATCDIDADTLGSAKALYQKGLGLLDEGNFAAAQREFEEAISIHPKYADAYYQLGVVRAQQNDLRGCEKWVQKAIEINPNIGQFYSMLGICSVQQNKLAAAEMAFRKASELLPEDPYTFFNLGMVLEKRQNFEGAEYAYLNAINIRSGDKRFHIKLAKVLEEEGKLKRSLIYYENALKFDPSDADAKRSIASIQLRISAASS